MFSYSSVQNPVWANEEHTIIFCEVAFDAFPGLTPFGANAEDVMEHGRTIFAEVVSGKWGIIGEYAAPVYEQSSGGIPIPQPTVEGAQTL